MDSVRVPGFLPSTRGLHFTNYFPHEPEIKIQLPLGKTLGLGDAANGLCGGMAFVARDYFEANQPIPSNADAPASDSPLYKFVVQRLLDSFNLPLGIGRYLELMEPSFPDASPGFGLPGRSSVMLHDEWPKIKADLDAGHPVPLGLVKVVSDQPENLGKNHQVLAYGYDLDGTSLTVWLYDPNYPNRDDIQFQLSTANAQAPVKLTYTPSAEQVFCFFQTRYAPKPPPA
jgi:hypothetical protein